MKDQIGKQLIYGLQLQPEIIQFNKTLLKALLKIQLINPSIILNLGVK